MCRNLIGARQQDLDGDGQISADEKDAAKEKRVKFGKIVRTNLKICVTQLVLALAGRAAAGDVDIRLRCGYANYDQGGETTHLSEAEREFRHEKERGQNSKNIEQ